MQIEFRDKKGDLVYGSKERFNAFNFNNFEGWECRGYRPIIIREPMEV